ncbi:MAG: DCC1-like thiol-disulfide oxidoreductase family protein [Litoreibacter sp.]
MEYQLRLNLRCCNKASIVLNVEVLAKHLLEYLLGRSAQVGKNRQMDSSNELRVIFDTDCVMCSSWVRFILRHERYPSATFVSAWSEQGLAIAAEHKLEPSDLNDTYLVVSNGRGFTKSDATFEIFRTLKAPWHLVSVLRITPRPLRDWFYDRMAINRYRWFGRQDRCFLPPEGQEARFIPGPPRSAVLPDHG